MNGAEMKSWPMADIVAEISARHPNQVVGFWPRGDSTAFRTMLTFSESPPPAANEEIAQ